MYVPFGYGGSYRRRRDMTPEEYAHCKRKETIAAIAALLVSAGIVAIAFLYRKVGAG